MDKTGFVFETDLRDNLKIASKYWLYLGYVYMSCETTLKIFLLHVYCTKEQNLNEVDVKFSLNKDIGLMAMVLKKFLKC